MFHRYTASHVWPVRPPSPQVPSNLIMLRVGFRSWMTFLICGWGIVSGSFMFIRSAWSFYLLRLLLGIFQSGAFPAMWHVLSVFFPRKQ